MKDVIEGRLEGERPRGRKRIMMLDSIKGIEPFQRMKKRAQDRQGWSDFQIWNLLNSSTLQITHNTSVWLFDRFVMQDHTLYQFMRERMYSPSLPMKTDSLTVLVPGLRCEQVYFLWLKLLLDWWMHDDSTRRFLSSSTSAASMSNTTSGFTERDWEVESGTHGAWLASTTMLTSLVQLSKDKNARISLRSWSWCCSVGVR